MALLIFLVIVVIGVAVGTILFIVSKQKKEFNYVLNEDIIGEQLSKDSKLYSAELMSNKRFEKLLSESIDRPDDLEILKKDIQNRARLFMKVSDIAKARYCNEQLRKIDIAIKQKGV